MHNTLELIHKAATIPSFSSYEHIMHPWIQSLVSQCPHATMEIVPDHNVLITVQGNPMKSPVALSSHIDKIDHFDDPSLDTLPASYNTLEITGQLDDTVGIGMCLSLMLQSGDYDFPTLYLLLSEMEESFGVRKHPERLRNQGKGLYAGMGAERLSEHLIQTQRIPSMVITIDTTPLFKGEPGWALYSKHWEKNNLEPTDDLIQATAEIEAFVLQQAPDIKLANNTNDYLHYGECLNQDPSRPVPCIAVEPAIYPYHQKNERVFLEDIQKTEALVKALLLREGT